MVGIVETVAPTEAGVVWTAGLAAIASASADAGAMSAAALTAIGVRKSAPTSAGTAVTEGDRGAMRAPEEAIAVGPVWRG